MVEFTKYPRDRKNQIINEGNIISFVYENTQVFAVVKNIMRYSREKMPELDLVIFRADWLGKNIEQIQATLPYKDYRGSNIILPEYLRDDYEYHSTIKNYVKTGKRL